MTTNSSMTTLNSAKAQYIAVVKEGECLLDNDELSLRDKIALRLVDRFSLVARAHLENDESISRDDTVGYLYFMSIDPHKQVYLDALDAKPTVIVWRGNPPRNLPVRVNCMNVCIGDPNALARIVGFFRQTSDLCGSEVRGSRSNVKGRGLFDEDGGESMRLAVDVRLFAFPELSERGIGHYALPHLRAVLASGFSLSPSLLIDSTAQIPDPVAQLAEEYGCRVIPLDAARNEQFDVVHLPDPVTILPGYDSPLRARPASRVTSTVFYDLIPLRIPDQHIDRWDPRSRSVYFNRLEQVVAHDCHLFAISECTRRDLIELLGIEPERITTIRAGQNYATKRPRDTSEATTANTKSRFGIRHPFFLNVGAIEKHKNFPLALEAFSLVRRSHACQLVIVGSFSDPFKEAYRELCQQQGIDDVIFTGFLKSEELEGLYADATAVLVPSLYEGFGFPALEAMEHGSPVIASAAASIPEVVGDAGILLSPTDATAWARAMNQLLHSPDEREQYRVKGVARAAEFSWEKNAALVLSVWRRMLNEVQMKKSQ